MLYTEIEERVSEEDIVLDIGTKSGSKLKNVDANIIGIDIDLKPSLDIQYLFGDGCQLPFKNDCFDYILCYQVLEHVHDKSLMLDEIQRVIKPSGVAMFSFPNRLFPGRPHSPPRWYSYLPRKWGVLLADILLTRQVANYYKNNVYNLSPISARNMLESRFQSVDYNTLNDKLKYRTRYLDKSDDYPHSHSPTSGGIFFTKYLLPIIQLMADNLLFTWVFELIFPEVEYICSDVKK
ncbi:class I SAM-dependent methyltransferase [Halomicroarcula sp. GCM10025817]|uniref:class I SAM-dependent methyltransferase n=1 Tax=Haloarcula TaxID=2237 RepID=UPI0023E88441|nr:class I SAM-dependent methyltransferase [Halomicroarcula sp. SYNS111]